jgi:hypothetical protein
MAEYIIMIFDPDTDWTSASEEEFAEVGRQFAAFEQAAEGMGVRVVGGNALQPASTATSIRGDSVTDGPFIESKEVLGGYYLIDAPDLDKALAFAKLCPTTAGVEVRPIMDVSGM